MVREQALQLLLYARWCARQLVFAAKGQLVTGSACLSKSL
jgi:hypothetical protein